MNQKKVFFFILYLHIVENLLESERHSTANDDLVHFVDHVVDQLDLIAHLRTKSSKEKG